MDGHPTGRCGVNDEPGFWGWVGITAMFAVVVLLVYVGGGT